MAVMTAPDPRVEDPAVERGGIEHEGEFAALREQGRALQGLAVVGAEGARHAVDAERLHGHEGGDAGRNDQRQSRRDHGEVERHADREEEQAEQDAAERLDVGFELMAEASIRTAARRR